jgi:quercetin dioxygenase-like cupin family protein
LSGTREGGPAELGTRRGQGRVVKAAFERKDARGVFREVLNGFEARTFITGRMEKDAVLGNHYHRKTRVFFYLTRGAALVAIFNVETGERDAFTLERDQGCFFEVNESHAVRFTEEGEFAMLKSLAYDPADPDTHPHPVEENL